MRYPSDTWVAEIGLMSPHGMVIATLYHKEFNSKMEADANILIKSMMFNFYGHITSRVYNKKDLMSDFTFWPR